MSGVFERNETILFRHCDPAGIVFFPRYLEMVNDSVEALFAKIGHPFHELHRGGGVPTVALVTEFTAPSRLGEKLALKLSVVAIGRTSADLRHEARGGGETRFRIRQRIVNVGSDMRPAPWPEDLRAALARYQETP